MPGSWDLGWVDDLVRRLVSDEAVRLADADVDWQATVEAETLLVLQGDYDSAYHGLRGTTALTDEQKKQFVQVVNDRYLVERELEWTNHGILRSFRFWPKEEKVEYLRTANRVVEVLEGVGSDVLLGFGSVLAYVRDADFIPHDDDLDLIVAFDRRDVSTLTEALDRVVAALEDAGCRVWGDLPTHRKARFASGHGVDVFVGLVEDGRVSWFPSARGGLAVDQVLPPQVVDFLGVPVKMPAKLDEYLAVTYGQDWATPIANWNHPWDQRQYADLLPPTGDAAPESDVSAAAPGPGRRPTLVRDAKRIVRNAERVCRRDGLERPAQVFPLLRRLSVDEFGELMWSMPNPAFPALSAILPAMASPAVQEGWTGASGTPLLRQTTSFVRSVELAYARHRGRSLHGATILDFGVGYGRTLRMMYRFSDPERLWAVDAWDRSPNRWADVELPGIFHFSGTLPDRLPVEGTKFDLAYAVSVFTHLSPTAAEACLSAVREWMEPGGLFVLTVRPVDFWRRHAASKEADPAALRAQHRATGFAYLPHAGAEGETYGDSSIAPAFFKRPGWRVVDRDWSAVDPFEMILVLQAVPTEPAAPRPEDEPATWGRHLRRAFGAIRRVTHPSARARQD